MHKPKSLLENKTNNILWDFKIPNSSHNIGQKTRPSDKKEKRELVVWKTLTSQWTTD